MALSDTLIPFSLFGSHYEGRDGKPYAVATVIVATDGSGNFEDIQSAINDLPSKGGVVYIKEGTYEITTPISITKSTVTVRGAGKSTIIYGNGCNAFNLGDNVVTYDKISIEACSIYTTAAAAEMCVRAFKCTNTRVLDCYIGAAYYGLYFNSTSTGCIVSGCHVTSSGMYSEGNYTIVDANVFDDCSYDAVHLWGASYSTVTGNSIRNGSQGVGVHVHQATTYSSITGNTIEGCLGSGIKVASNSDFNILSSNICEGNGDHGIDINDAASDKNLVVGNICLGNTNANYNDSGTNTTAGNNITA